MARERDVRLDVLKALAILLVIFGHAVTLVFHGATNAPVWLATAFSVGAATDVQLFMFIAGYLAPRRAGATWVGHRAMRLVVPLVAWSMIAFFWVNRAAGPLWFWRLLNYPFGGGLWFLYVLFELCVLYALVGWNRWLLIATAVACLFIDPSVRIAAIGMVAPMFPLFVAGRLLSERKFEPGPWVMVLAVVLLAAVWTVPGANPMYSVPEWSIRLSNSLGTTAWFADPVMILLRALRIALELSLVASCFWLVRKVKHGAWLGAITLGMYASHQFFLPTTFSGSIQPLDVITVTLIAAVGSAGTALLLERWQTTQFLLLGWGKLPSWVTDRLGRKAAEDA